MAKPFEIHVGDTARRWEVRLRDDWDGVKAPVNLATQADSATFRMRNAKTGAIKVNATANLTGDPADGLVYYEWIGSDVDTAGDYEVVVVVVKSGKPRTYPSNGFWRVKIHPQIT